MWVVLGPTLPLPPIALTQNLYIVNIKTMGRLLGGVGKRDIKPQAIIRHLKKVSSTTIPHEDTI